MKTELPESKVEKEKWYDLFDDFGLIEASFVAQYGIRLRQDDMCWNEFCTLLSGLSSETPLGTIVAIRSEENKDRLEQFSIEEHRIRNEYRNKNAKQEIKKQHTDEELKILAEQMKAMFMSIGTVKEN